MGPIGAQEMIFIFILALLLFGPKKLPELGRMLGKGLTEFRRAKNELKSTFETHLHELERETRLEESKSNSSSTYTSPDYSSPRYPYPYDEYGHTDSTYSAPSGTSDSHASHNSSNAESETASATATQDAEAYRDHSSSSPVTGTVPRSNGVQPVEPVSVSAKEDRPA